MSFVVVPKVFRRLVLDCELLQSLFFAVIKLPNKKIHKPLKYMETYLDSK